MAGPARAQLAAAPGPEPRLPGAELARLPRPRIQPESSVTDRDGGTEGQNSRGVPGAELLDTLRTLTGGQVVAVTLDRVAASEAAAGTQASLQILNRVDTDGPGDGGEDARPQNVFKKYQKVAASSSKPTQFKYYQSDSRRIQQVQQHKRQDRQLRDFAIDGRVKSDR